MGIFDPIVEPLRSADKWMHGNMDALGKTVRGWGNAVVDGFTGKNTPAPAPAAAPGPASAPSGQTTDQSKLSWNPRTWIPAAKSKYEEVKESFFTGGGSGDGKDEPWYSKLGGWAKSLVTDKDGKFSLGKSFALVIGAALLSQIGSGGIGALFMGLIGIALIAGVMGGFDKMGELFSGASKKNEGPGQGQQIQKNGPDGVTQNLSQEQLAARAAGEKWIMNEGPNGIARMKSVVDHYTRTGASLGPVIATGAAAAIVREAAAKKDNKSQLDPYATGDGGKAVGILQLNSDDRKADFLNTYNFEIGAKVDKNGKPVSEQRQLEAQFDFVVHELTTNPRFAQTREKINNAKTPDEVARIMTAEYFVPANKEIESEKRAGIAALYAYNKKKIDETLAAAATQSPFVPKELVRTPTPAITLQSPPVAAAAAAGAAGVTAAAISPETLNTALADVQGPLKDRFVAKVKNEIAADAVTIATQKRDGALQLAKRFEASGFDSKTSIALAAHYVANAKDVSSCETDSLCADLKGPKSNLLAEAAKARNSADAAVALNGAFPMNTDKHLLKVAVIASALEKASITAGMGGQVVGGRDHDGSVTPTAPVVVATVDPKLATVSP